VGGGWGGGVLGVDGGCGLLCFCFFFCCVGGGGGCNKPKVKLM